MWIKLHILPILQLCGTADVSNFEIDFQFCSVWKTNVSNLWVSIHIYKYTTWIPCSHVSGHFLVR